MLLPALPLGLVISARDGDGELHAEAAMARRGRAVLLACGTPGAPTCWMELDILGGIVRQGSLGCGYVVTRPTRRWCELRVEHVARPQFRIDVRVLH